MRLNPESNTLVKGGEILFEGQDILGLSERQMQKVRGPKIAMVFQDPMTSLDPTTLGAALREAGRIADQHANGSVPHVVPDVISRPGSTVRTWTPFMPWSPNLTDSTTTAAAAGSPR